MYRTSSTGNNVSQCRHTMMVMVFTSTAKEKAALAICYYLLYFASAPFCLAHT